MDTQGVCGSLSSSYGNMNSIARSWKVATERGLMVLVGKVGLACIQASVEAIRGRACKWKLLGWQRRWREKTGRHRYRHLPRGDSQASESPQKGPMFHQSGKPAPNCSAIESNGKKTNWGPEVRDYSLSGLPLKCHMDFPSCPAGHK